MTNPDQRWWIFFWQLKCPSYVAIAYRDLTTYTAYHKAIFDQLEDKIATNPKPRNIICGLWDAEQIPKAFWLQFLHLAHLIFAEKEHDRGLAFQRCQKVVVLATTCGLGKEPILKVSMWCKILSSLTMYMTGVIREGVTMGLRIQKTFWCFLVMLASQEELYLPCAQWTRIWI